MNATHEIQIEGGADLVISYSYLPSEPDTHDVPGVGASVQIDQATYKGVDVTSLIAEVDSDFLTRIETDILNTLDGLSPLEHYHDFETDSIDWI